MFNDAVFEQILNCKVFENQLVKFIVQSTLPLYELLQSREDQTVSSLAQSHHSVGQVEQFQQARKDFLDRLALATQEKEAITSSDPDEELKAAYLSFLQTKPARNKDTNIAARTKRAYYVAILNDGKKASLQQYVTSAFGPSTSLTEFTYKANCSFKTFDQGLIGYISDLPGTTAAVLCNAGIAFFEFLKEKANRVEVAFDDLLNENKRMKYLSGLSAIVEKLSRKTSSLHKKYITEKDMREEAQDCLQPGQDLLILDAYPRYFLSDPFKDMLASLENLAQKAKQEGISASDRNAFHEVTVWLMLQLVMFNGGRAQTADLFKNKHFLAKLVATVNPEEKTDYTKIKFQFKGLLDKEDFQKYVIGAFDVSEQGNTGAIRLILPKVLASGMEQYHYIKTVINSEEAYVPDGPFFINMDGNQEWIILWTVPTSNKNIFTYFFLWTD